MSQNMHSWVSKEQCDTQDQKKMTKMLCLLPVSVVINQHKVVSETNTQQLSYIFCTVVAWNFVASGAHIALLHTPLTLDLLPSCGLWTVNQVTWDIKRLSAAKNNTLRPYRAYYSTVTLNYANDVQCCLCYCFFWNVKSKMPPQPPGVHASTSLPASIVLTLWNWQTGHL